MADYFMLFNAMVCIVLAFGAARFGWEAGFYAYYAARRASNSVANKIANTIKRGER